jgi:HK97 family phage portal protein
VSILARLTSRQNGMEKRDLMSSSFVPPPQVGVIDDYLGVHRAMACMTVLACVRVLADTIASLPWKAYRRDSKGVPKEVKPQPALLREPFPGFDLFQWKWMVVASLALRGNSYHLVTSRDKLNNPTSLLPLHPDIVFLERRPDILMWFEPVYRVMGEQVNRADMIHIRRFTMPGEPWGLSPVKQAAVAIGMSLGAEEFGYRYFKESANPSGILFTDQDLDEKAVERQQKNWIASHGGRRLPAVLTNGFQWQNLTISPEESQFLATRQFQRSEICLMYGVPPILIGDTKECVVAGTLMTMADGSRKLVEDLRVGDRVMAWDGSKLVASPVSWIGTPPIKPIVKMTTVRGRELTCTADHPILGLQRLRSPGNRPLPTDGEWLYAGDLQPGNYVRIGLGHLPDETGHLSGDIGYFLGSMVGDGHIRMDHKHYSCWANTNLDVIARMSNIVQSLGGSLKFRGHRSFDLLNSGHTSVIGGILKESGLVGSHAHDKFVPDMVMAGGPAAWRGFLSGYFDADGCVSITAKQPHAHFASTSRELLEGCQHLLALLGINSSLCLGSRGGRRTMPRGGESDCRDAWQLRVKGKGELAKLAQTLDLAHWAKKRKLAAFTGSGKQVRPVVFEFDRVKTIEHLGDGQTVGIEIEGTHTHVTNGIISHNTTAWGTGVEQITLGAITFTFRAWTSCMESMVSRCLPRGQYCQFDYDSLLRGDIEGRYKAYALALGSSTANPWIAANEVRAKEEMDPIEGGEQLYISNRMMPATFPPAANNPPPPPQTPGSFPMPPIAGGESDHDGQSPNGAPRNGRGFLMRT